MAVTAKYSFPYPRNQSNFSSTLADSLVWGVYFADDGAGYVRANTLTSTFFTDLLSNEVYSFRNSSTGSQAFESGEGLVISDDQRHYGIKSQGNASATIYQDNLAGIDFTKATDSQWMLVIHVESNIDTLSAGGFGTLFSVDDVLTVRTDTSGDLHVSYLGAETDLGSAPDLVNGSNGDAVLVIASDADGGVRVNWTNKVGGPALVAAGTGLIAADRNIHIFGQESGSVVTGTPTNNNIYSAQLLSRSSEFTDIEIASMISSPYQVIQEEPNLGTLQSQATDTLNFDKPFCWIGDSQFIENQNRLPHGINRYHVPVNNVSSMYASPLANSAAFGATRTYTEPTGVDWTAQAQNIDHSSKPADLDDYIANSFGVLTFTGDAADNAEVFNQLVWNSSTPFLGSSQWTQDKPINTTWLYATRTTATEIPELQLRTQRGGSTSTLDFAPDYDTTGIKAVSRDVPSGSASAQVFGRIRAGSDDETGGSLVNLGFFHEIQDAGVRRPGYGHDSHAQAGFDPKEWTDNTTELAFGQKWALTVLPQSICIMLGHNQSTDQTTQLDSGSLSGTWTNEYHAFVDMICGGLAVARNIMMDWSVRTRLIFTTPWRAFAGSSAADDPVNIGTLQAITALTAESYNAVHVDLYNGFDQTNPLAGGLHPGDGAGDDTVETKLVADTWISSHIAASHGQISYRMPRIRRLRHRRFRNGFPRTIERFLNDTQADVAGTAQQREFTATAATDQITITGHGLASGDGPFAIKSSIALPAGLDQNRLYFVNSVNANALTLHTTFREAVNGTNAVDITNTGTGTHILYYSSDPSALVGHLRKGTLISTLATATDIDDID